MVVCARCLCALCVQLQLFVVSLFAPVGICERDSVRLVAATHAQLWTSRRCPSSTRCSSDAPDIRPRYAGGPPRAVRHAASLGLLANFVVVRLTPNATRRSTGRRATCPPSSWAKATTVCATYAKTQRRTKWSP